MCLIVRLLSIYTWNPAPRRGKEVAFEKQIAGKWHVITLQEAIEYVNHDILQVGFTWPIMHVARFSSTRTPSTLILKSSLFTFMIPGAICLIRWWKETRCGFCKGCFHVPHFVDLLSAARKLLQFCFYVLPISTPKKRGNAKKLILTIRAIMICQHVDLVAGDFNGTAWRCSNRNNISTIDEVFADCALPTPGPSPLWRPWSIPNNWADVCGFLEPPGSDRYWLVRTHGAFSIRPPDQSCHETWLHVELVDWCSTQSHHEEHDRRILLKERPTACPFGQQQRRTSEVTSRPFALFVTVRPFARVYLYYAKHAHPHEVTWWHFAFTSILSFSRSSLSALAIHVAQHFSRTSRHGVKKRTHRVALDWLFVRINMDPKIQLKYVDTKNQLEDKLTKGNFTQALPQRRVRMHQIVRVCRACGQQGLNLIAIAGTQGFLIRMTRRRVLKCGKKMQRRRNCEETRCCRNEPRSGFSKKRKETCRSNFRNHRRRLLGEAEQPPHISCLRSAPREFILESIIGGSTFYPSQPQRIVKQLFDVTMKLIRDQKEIQGKSVIDWQQKQ